MGIPERIGNVRVEERLAAGGMGEVYRGFDEKLERPVAIKAIRSDGISAAARTRFLREARTLSQLDHPHICRIYDYVEVDGSEYLILELIAGSTLAEAIERGLSSRAQLAIAEQIAAVLAAAHDLGVIHRDLKPGNVMVTGDGDVKVLDFGLARRADVPVSLAAAPKPDAARSAVAFETMSLLADAETAIPDPMKVTRAADVVGTPGYMSPEQARGDDLSTASDIYSFGLLLHALFTGRPPHPAGLSATDLYERTLRGESSPTRTDDPDLDTLIANMKAASAAQRPTASEVLDRVRWIIDKPRRQQRRLLGAAALVIVALAGAKYVIDVRTERNEARLRQAQAESLIGFMLGDLRDKLEGVGRLDVLDDVGQRALEYFETVPENELSTEELSRRAQALAQIGDVELARGNLDPALAAFETSLRFSDALSARGESEAEPDEALLRRSEALSQIGQARLAEGSLDGATEVFRGAQQLALALSERDPDNTDWLANLGAAEFWLGYVDFSRTDLAAARRRFERYLAASERMVELQPDNADWELELMYSHSNLGSVLQAEGQLRPALGQFLAALEINQRLAAQNPADVQFRFELGTTHNTVAVIQEALGDLEAARSNYADDLEIKRAVAASDPANSDWQLSLSRAQSFMAYAELTAGNAEAALALLQEQKAVLEALSEGRRSLAEWQRDLATNARWTGEAHRDLGDSTRAVAKLGEAVAALSDVIGADPANARWTAELAQTLATRASMIATDRPDAALADADRALDLVAAPSTLGERRAVAQAHLARGTALAGLGRGAAAEAAWTLVTEITSPDTTDSADLWLLALRAQAVEALGLPEATSLQARLAASNYHRPH